MVVAATDLEAGQGQPLYNLKVKVDMTLLCDLLWSDKVYWQVSDHPAKGTRRKSLQGRLSWEKKTFVCCHLSKKARLKGGQGEKLTW